MWFQFSSAGKPQTGGGPTNALQLNRGTIRPTNMNNLMPDWPIIRATKDFHLRGALFVGARM